MLQSHEARHAAITCGRVLLKSHEVHWQFNAEMHLFGLCGPRIFVDCPHAEITRGRNLHKSHEMQLAAITCGRRWLESHEAHRAEIT